MIFFPMEPINNLLMLYCLMFSIKHKGFHHIR